MEQNNDFLGTEPVGKLLWKLSIPAIAAQIINLLYNLVDRVYIGHMPDDGALLRALSRIESDLAEP